MLVRPGEILTGQDNNDQTKKRDKQNGSPKSVRLPKETNKKAREALTHKQAKQEEQAPTRNKDRREQAGLLTTKLHIGQVSRPECAESRWRTRA